ncbi:hypothetical protein MJI20_29810, partial [Salmonella enterica subsp. enterica serovar Anatum]|nr:hypothetical protein [Salmonella enterica subsp. enterica serovar Anatum]
RPSMEKDDEQEVFYTTALPQEQADGYVQSAHPVLLQGGEYVITRFAGFTWCKRGMTAVELDMVFDLNEISFSGHCPMGNWSSIA